MALALIPRTKKTKARGAGVCTVTRGPNKGKARSCAKQGGAWRSRKPLSELTAAGRKRRAAVKATRKKGGVCRLERVSQYGNVRCMKVCRKGGKITSRKSASGCGRKAPRSRLGKVK